MSRYTGHRDESLNAAPAGPGEQPAALPVVREHAIGGRMVQAVMARDLHRSLGTATQYADWFKEQLASAKLTKGVDYEEGGFQPELKNPLGGRPRKDSVITFEAAKRIGMMSRTPGGDRVRAYFLDCEYRMINFLGPPDAAARKPLAIDGSGSDAEAVDRADRMDGTVPVGMAEFLTFKGLDRTQANATTRIHQAKPLEAVRSRHGDGVIRRHPFNKRWLFRESDLERWWRVQRKTLLSMGR